ncbi:hypothetical protein Trydic_g22028, partial [Trypoxylus dichotomus]
HPPVASMMLSSSTRSAWSSMVELHAGTKMGFSDEHFIQMVSVDERKELTMINTLIF